MNAAWGGGGLALANSSCVIIFLIITQKREPTAASPLRSQQLDAYLASGMHWVGTPPPTKWGATPWPGLPARTSPLS